MCDCDVQAPRHVTQHTSSVPMGTVSLVVGDATSMTTAKMAVTNTIAVSAGNTHTL